MLSILHEANQIECNPEMQPLVNEVMEALMVESNSRIGNWGLLEPLNGTSHDPEINRQALETVLEKIQSDRRLLNEIFGDVEKEDQVKIIRAALSRIEVAHQGVC